MDAAVFDAIADPTRRRLLELLSERESRAGELAEQFTTARPTVSRHLRVLRDAGLVSWRGDAQRRLYRLDPQPLAEAGAWVDRVQQRWAARLDELERHLDAQPPVPGDEETTP